jgi:nucleoside-diphosphate-sugar epimerase
MEGNGVRTMNMIHRQDAVGTIVAALQRGRPGEVYNVVDDEPVSQLDCFEWLSRELNRPMPVSVPEDRQSARKRGLTNKRVSNRKLKAEFDYVFRYPTFRDGYRAEIEAGQK